MASALALRGAAAQPSPSCGIMQSVRGELGSAPRPAAGEHERSPTLVTREVNKMKDPLSGYGGTMSHAYHLGIKNNKRHNILIGEGTT